MTKKTNLKAVGEVRSEEDRKKYAAEYDRWDKAYKGWRITPQEAANRVRSLRAELEYHCSQVEAMNFGITCDEIPYCLDWTKRKYSYELVDALNPFVDGILEMIDAYAKQHGCHEFLDFQSKLFDMKSQAAETAFRIGVLAGVIFAGRPKEEVDRFERGLAFELSHNPWICKLG
jgi:hypothetical protein